MHSALVARKRNTFYRNIHYSLLRDQAILPVLPFHQWRLHKHANSERYVPYYSRLTHEAYNCNYRKIPQ